MARIYYSEAAYKRLIEQSQRRFDRLMRRASVSTNTAERTFLLVEAKQAASELRSMAREWRRYTNSSSQWVTHGYSIAEFRRRTR